LTDNGQQFAVLSNTPSVAEPTGNSDTPPEQRSGSTDSRSVVGEEIDCQKDTLEQSRSYPSNAFTAPGPTKKVGISQLPPPISAVSTVEFAQESEDWATPAEGADLEQDFGSHPAPPPPAYFSTMSASAISAVEFNPKSDLESSKVWATPAEGADLEQDFGSHPAPLPNTAKFCKVPATPPKQQGTLRRQAPKAPAPRRVRQVNHDSDPERLHGLHQSVASLKNWEAAHNQAVNGLKYQVSTIEKQLQAAKQCNDWNDCMMLSNCLENLVSEMDKEKAALADVQNLIRDQMNQIESIKAEESRLRTRGASQENKRKSVTFGESRDRRPGNMVRTRKSPTTNIPHPTAICMFGSKEHCRAVDCNRYHVKNGQEKPFLAYVNAFTSFDYDPPNRDDEADALHI